MTISARTFIRFSSGVVLLIFVLVALSPLLYAQEMEFTNVKKRGIVKDKVVETANMYADVLQFDAKGKVKDEMITEVINVIIPKGNMTPGEIMLENIYGLITIGAGPEFLILKEILISEDRREAVMKGLKQTIFIFADLVESGTPALNEGSKLLNQSMSQATHTFAYLIKKAADEFIIAFDPKRRARERVLTVIPAEPPLIYPDAMAKVHQLRDGPWVFVWAEPPSPHGVKEYIFQLRNPNTREVMLETSLKETYIVIPRRNRTFSGRKQTYWAWTVTPIGSDNAKGLNSIRGFYVRELEE
ncbi:hypothetical protein ACFLT2_05145 [Acidobacteriota bacterium]